MKLGTSIFLLIYTWIMKQIHQNICLRWCHRVIYKNGSMEKLGNLELRNFFLAGQHR